MQRQKKTTNFSVRSKGSSEKNWLFSITYACILPCNGSSVIISLFFFPARSWSTHMMAGTSATVYKAASRLMKISSCVFFWWLFVGSTRRQKAPKAAQSTTIHLAPPLPVSTPPRISCQWNSRICITINLTFPSQHPSCFNTKIKVPTKIYFNLSSQQKGGPPFKHMGKLY